MRNDEMLLNTAIDALQATEPESAQVAASARRVADRLGLGDEEMVMSNSSMAAIQNCADVHRLRSAFRAGELSGPRTQLIEAHLRDCGSCLRHYRSDTDGAALDWSAPKAERSFTWRPSLRSISWALAPTFALLACSFFVYKIYWQIPPGVRAEVESIDGSVYRITNSTNDSSDAAADQRLTAGDKLAEGEHLRTTGGSHAVLRLSDGSKIEVNERSVLGVGAQGHSMTLSLDNGAVIVQAARRDSGHLYVKTPDCRVAVTGTVFSVDSGIKGSRVAVLQGSVQVMHAGVDSVVHAGDQIATSDNLSHAPIEQEISWSHDRDNYISLLAQAALIEHRLAGIPVPQLRYSSDLIQRVPADTLLYVSIPNLGDYLSEANKVFQDQLKQSPALAQWWNRTNNHNGADNTAQLNLIVEKLHQMSQYVGDEVVLVGVKQSSNPGFAVVADVKRSGLDDFLKSQISIASQNPGLAVLNEKSLAASSSSTQGLFALVREHEAVFSNSIATLKQIDAQLNAGASGFASGDFGKQIEAAYGRGAGVILAADLHQMITGLNADKSSPSGHSAIENSGMQDVEYLIAEHREANGLPENHLNLQFSGTRQRVASWLAAPAPIGSLDFVSPNAAVVVAGLTKDPATIADDLLAMAAPGQNEDKSLSDVEAKLQINFRDDLAANLGGDFLLSLDGPVLPTPAWKAVIEVRDSAKMESALERLTKSISAQMQGKGQHQVTIDSSDLSGQRFYSLREIASGRSIANYTFADGYMIIAPDRALLIDALRTHAGGDSLAHSAAFKALLPKDDHENYSAIAYQNLSPVLTPLLPQFSGETAQALRQLAQDARPTAICAWGMDSRIEAASDSHLFGFDFLTLGTLIHSTNHSGNKLADASVRD